MALNLVITNYSNGYVAEYVQNGTEICSSWILLPAENLWPKELRAFLYVLAMLYLFIGVAIGSDVFMTSIEVITSKKRRIVYWDADRNENITKEVFVWNETVANLTLLALGSSAPEILLATVEAITEIASGKSKNGQGLGFYTIMGSAAFNLLIITAICIMSVKSPNVKRMRELGVFILTAIWSLLAYVWLLAVLTWISPGRIEIWEAVVTLIFFPLLVMTAYAQDNHWWIHKFRGRKISHAENANGDANNVAMHSVTDGIDTMPKRIIYGDDELDDVNKIEEVNNLHQLPSSNGDHLPTIVEEGNVVNSPGHHHQQQTPHVALSPPPDSPKNMLPHKEYKPFARARFRHFAIMSLGGGSRATFEQLDRSERQTAQASPPKQTLSDIVSKYAEENRIASVKSTVLKTAASMSFSSPSYSVMENAGDLHVDVLLHMRARMKMKINTNGETNNNGSVPVTIATVEYETREASAKANKDFKYTNGTLEFHEGTFKQTISVPIINDDQYNPDTDFYILLKNPVGDVCLGDPSVCRVTIIDDDKPGDFILESSQLHADMEEGYVQVLVMRQNGSDGSVSVDYATVDGTAKGGEKISDGMDYITTSGTLPFKHNEESKSIKVFVNKECRAPKNFVLVLRNPSQGSHLGEHSATVINMNLDPQGIAAFVVGPDEDESWTGQIRNAMAFGKDYDENGAVIIPGKFEYLLHFLAFLWKILFALVPTKSTLGGYPAFIISLLLIGGIAAVIEQLGTLLGCAVDLKNAVTGITIIALGTSVPDTFASRTAAVHHDCADASIGNITGSNSVNVFLGLGLPWLIRSVYAEANNTQYVVDSTGIEFAIILFDSFGAVCIVLLLIRRFVFGGELGGHFTSKVATSAFLALLWFIYVLTVSLKAYKYF